MKIYILDYKGRKTEVELDMDKIGSIEMDVVTGDEILRIVYKDYTIGRIDSCANGRIEDCFDDSYTVFNESKGINLLTDQNWLNRGSSYDYSSYDFMDEAAE